MAMATSNPLIDLEGGAYSGYGGQYGGSKMEIAMRNAFVRKVLSITACQLILTSIVTAGILFNSSVRAVLVNPAVMLISVAVTLGSFFALYCGQARKYPMNWILLTLFTLGESVTVGTICLGSVEKVGSPAIIVKALGATAIVVTALTVWAMQSKKDFADYMGYFVCIGFALMGVSLLNIFFKSSLMSTLLSAGFAVVFGFYLLFDIQTLFRKDVDFDDYILMSLNIYLDVVTIFIELLKLLTSMESNDN